MNPHHTSLLKTLKKHAGKGTTLSASDSYLSSGHCYYNISVPVRRQIAKDWLRENSKVSDKDFLAMLDSLFQGASHEEKTMASILLGYHTTARSRVTFTQIDRWLDELVGWAEIDSLCAGIFTPQDFLDKRDGWEKFLRKLVKDKNINKRRAGLVFLVRPLAKSDDQRILKLALDLVDQLKHEKEILITKAISWVLRSGVAQHKEAMRTYLKKEKESLPKIAIRETVRKIETGRK